MGAMRMDQTQLLVEVEDLIRTRPTTAFVANTDVELAWLGRLTAVIENWNSTIHFSLNNSIDRLDGTASSNRRGLREIMLLLHHARHDLRMKTIGPANLAVPQGEVFQYFDEIRKIIELARQDVLFVDPYLDAEFVSRYLPHIADGVTVRLLARERVATLIPAVEVFAKQNKKRIEVRSTPNFHDRYVFVDKTSCYQSGASFKDGAKSAPTTLTQITDAFDAVLKTYEDIWSGAKVER